jgi:prolyl oligopeptidase
MVPFRLVPLLVLAVASPFAALAAPPAPSPPSGPPRARVETVVDRSFGTEAPDPYRWMEKAGGTEFLEWVGGQGRYARERLDAIPDRAAILTRIRELSLGTASTGAVYRAGPRLFLLRTDVGASLSKLIVRDAKGNERVLLDPAKGSAKGGGHLSIDNLAPSPDGARIACNLAEGGGEVTRVHVLDAATGKESAEVIDHIWGEFPVSWVRDGSGFFYTEMAPEAFSDPKADKLQNMRVRYHRMGTATASDPLLLGPGISGTLSFEPREFPSIWVPRGSDVALAYGSGARSEFRLFVARVADARRPGATWTHVADYDDLVENADVHGADLYLLTSKDAPNRRIVKVSAKEPDLAKAQVVVPESQDAVVTSLTAARDALYFRRMKNGIDTIWRLAYGASAPEEVALPYPGAAFELRAEGDRDGATFPLEGWVQPRAWFEYRPGEKKLRDLGLRSTSPADFSNIVVEAIEVPSSEGAMVPLTILHARDQRLDGSHPTLMTGYGGYGISQQPSFSPSRLAWLERGGNFAVAAVRGGGEKGRAWQLAGKSANKKNGIHDFIACGEALCARGYTSPARLACMGTSMGGVLAGGAVTERPDLFGAAVIRVGILNTVRILEGTNGANQVPELASPETAEGYKTLLAMDAYQRIRDGVAYPAMLLEVGLNDQRVSPWHSGKFGARLQAATTSGKPILLRSDSDTGHGIGSTRDQVAELNADIYAFLFSQLSGPGVTTSR